MAFANSRIAINNTSWTEIANAPAHFRVQNTGGDHVMIYYGASAPSPDLAGEVLLPYSIDTRADLASLAVKAYARSTSPTATINVETE